MPRPTRSAPSQLAGMPGTGRVSEPRYVFSPCRHVLISVFETRGLYECANCKKPIASVVREELCPGAQQALQKPPDFRRPITMVETAVGRLQELTDAIYIDDSKLKMQSIKDEDNASMCQKSFKTKNPAAAAAARMDTLEAAVEAQLEDFDTMMRDRDEVLERLDRLVGAWSDATATHTEQAPSSSSSPDGRTNNKKQRRSAAGANVQDQESQTGEDDDPFVYVPHKPIQKPVPAFGEIRKRKIKGVPDSVCALFEELPLDFKPKKKPLKAVLLNLREIYDAKIEADDYELEFGGRRQSLCSFVMDFFVTKFGQRKAAEMHVVELFISVNGYRDASVGAYLFGRFCGMFNKPLLDDDLKFYLSVLRALKASLPDDAAIVANYRMNEDDGTGTIEVLLASEIAEKVLARQEKNQMSGIAESKLCMAREKFQSEGARATGKTVEQRVQELAWKHAKRTARFQSLEPNVKPAAVAVDLDEFLAMLMEEIESENRSFTAFLQELLLEGDLNGDGRLTFFEFSGMAKKAFPNCSQSQMLKMYRDALGESEDLEKILMTHYMTADAVKLNPRKLAVVVQEGLKAHKLTQNA